MLILKEKMIPKLNLWYLNVILGEPLKESNSLMLNGLNFHGMRLSKSLYLLYNKWYLLIFKMLINVPKISKNSLLNVNDLNNHFILE